VLSRCHFRPLPADHLDGIGDGAGIHGRRPCQRDIARRAPVSAHAAFCRHDRADALHPRARRHARSRGIPRARPRNGDWDHGDSPMSLTRRALLTGGFIAAGTGVVAAIAAAGRRYGLVPPDSGGIYGAGETLAYAAHRLLGRHALAREFPRDMISAKPFANSIARPNDAFKRHQAANFTTW